MSDNRMDISKMSEDIRARLYSENTEGLDENTIAAKEELEREIKRSTRELTDEERALEYAKELNMYNLENLEKRENRVCFICTDKEDADIISDAGYPSIALFKDLVNIEPENVTEQAKALAIYLNMYQRKIDFVICLSDSIESYRLATQLNRDYYTVTVWYESLKGDYESLAERYQEDGEGVRFDLLNKVKDLRGKAKRDYQAQSNQGYLRDFYESTIRGEQRLKRYRTGFTELDNMIGGGVTAGLYIIGGSSAGGKTTFCLQIADKIAAQGVKVLYVSLEMSRDDLIARSLSRQSYILDPESSGKLYSPLAMTESEIYDAKFNGDGDPRKEQLKKAYESLKDSSQNMVVWETKGAPATEDIRAKIDNIRDTSGCTPVVFIDYLQKMTSSDLDISRDKRASIDAILMDIKQISRDYNTPVILISSFNRDSCVKGNYKSAFKESGEIEYTADVLIDYQFRALDEYIEKGWKYSERSELAESIKEERRMELVIAKNRRGKAGLKDYLTYLAKYNYFMETGETGEMEDIQQEEEDTPKSKRGKKDDFDPF